MMSPTLDAPAFVESDVMMDAPAFAEPDAPDAPDALAPVEFPETAEAGETAAIDAEVKPKRRRRARKPKETEGASQPMEAANVAVEPAAEPTFPSMVAETVEPERVPAVRELVAVATEVADDVMTTEKPSESPKEDAKEREAQDAKTLVIDVDSPEVRASIKPRRGWWRRP